MFAKSVKEFPSAYDLWAKKTRNKMSPYNCVFKNNYDAIEHNDVSQYVRIFPDSNFFVHPESFIFNKDYLYVSFNPAESNISNYNNVKYFQAAVIIFCKDSIIDIQDEFRFINYLSPLPKVKNNGTVSLSLALSNNEIINPEMPSLLDYQKSELTFFSQHSVFIAFMTLGYGKNIMHNSQTISILNQ
ncbi:MAG: hypothetical protein WC644_00725 [Ignavibacteria bacterium]